MSYKLFQTYIKYDEMVTFCNNLLSMLLSIAANWSIHIIFKVNNYLYVLQSLFWAICSRAIAHTEQEILS